VKRAISLGCALMAGVLAGCQQTVVLDDVPPDAGGPAHVRKSAQRVPNLSARHDPEELSGCVRQCTHG